MSKIALTIEHPKDQLSRAIFEADDIIDLQPVGVSEAEGTYFWLKRVKGKQFCAEGMSAVLAILQAGNWSERAYFMWKNLQSTASRIKACADEMNAFELSNAVGRFTTEYARFQSEIAK